MTDDLIKYKQWISTDRSNSEEHQDEAVLILDFAENYLFVAQDCGQSYHWNNAQATIHPFVLYFWILRQKKLAVLCFHVSVIIDS